MQDHLKKVNRSKLSHAQRSLSFVRTAHRHQQPASHEAMEPDCSNWTENSSLSWEANRFDVTHECARFDFMVYTVAAGSMCFFGVIGNALSFAVMLNDGPPRSATSFLLQALAVADTLVLVAAVPLYVLPPLYTHAGVIKAYYELYIEILPFLWPVYLVPYTGTIFMTVLVSVNRYEAVCRPFNTAKLCSNDKVRRHVIYIALFSLLYNIPRFFEYEKNEICVGQNATRGVFEISSLGGNTIYRVVYANVLYFVVMLGGPLVSLAFLNVNLIRALKVQARRRTEMRVTSSSPQTDITLVLVVVVFVFIVCQTPTFVDHILWTAIDESRRVCGAWHYYYTAIGDLMAICNSSVNFVIYVLTSPKFRVTLASMLLRPSICTAAAAKCGVFNGNTVGRGGNYEAESVIVRLSKRVRAAGAVRTLAPGQVVAAELAVDGGGRQVVRNVPDNDGVDDCAAETILLYKPVAMHGSIEADDAEMV